METISEATVVLVIICSKVNSFILPLNTPILLSHRGDPEHSPAGLTRIDRHKHPHHHSYWQFFQFT